MDIIQNFGINPLLLSAQAVNFLIILLLLKRFAYKPVLEMLQKRQQAIQNGYDSARKAEDALKKAEEQEKIILRGAQSEAKELLRNAARQADEIIAKAMDKGKTQAEKLISDTREQLEKDRRDTERQLAEQVVALALQMLEKSMTGFFGTKQQKEVVEQAAKRLKGQMHD